MPQNGCFCCYLRNQWILVLPFFIGGMKSYSFEHKSFIWVSKPSLALIKIPLRSKKCFLNFLTKLSPQKQSYMLDPSCTPPNILQCPDRRGLCIWKELNTSLVILKQLNIKAKKKKLSPSICADTV